MNIITRNLLYIVCLYAFSLKAQTPDVNTIHKDDEGNITFVRFTTNPSEEKKMSNGANVLKELLRGKQVDEFRIIDTHTDKRGKDHTTFHQYYRGIKVDDGIYKIHGKNNRIASINGKYADVNISSVTPNITEQEALQKALLFVGAEVYSWEDESMKQFLKNKKYGVYASELPKGKLVISKDRLITNTSWQLAWSFSISSLNPISSQVIYIDAISGQVLNSISKLCNANAIGSAETRYSGTRTITTDLDLDGFEYKLRETRSGVNIKTLNMNEATEGKPSSIMNFAFASDFIDNNNNWTAAEHSENDDQVALDIHWATETVLDYWRIVHQRNSFDANLADVDNYIHYGKNYENAGYHDVYDLFIFGDGYLDTNPWGSLDLVAHEFGHAIDEHSSSNLYYSDESGAIDESIADIWGAVIEHWAAPEKEHWMLFEEIDITNVGLRSMNNPSSIYYDFYNGQLTGYYPDTYKGNGYYEGILDKKGVHINSSIMNYWFYLLSDGDSGTNDNNHDYCVDGIGINEAAKIVYSITQNYLTSNATFMEARESTIIAAIDIYGAGSNEEIEVTNAWYAVGVGDKFGSTLDISGFGFPIVCNSNSTFTLQNRPAGTTVSWSKSSNLTYVSGQGSDNYTVKAASSTTSGVGWVEATIEGCGSFVPREEVWVGPYNTSIIYMSGTYGVCQGELYTYTLNLPNGHQSGYTYQWNKPNNWYINNQGTNWISLRVPQYSTPDYGVVEARVNNGCGWSPYTGVTVYPGYSCGGVYSYSVFPNPANSSLTIERTLDDELIQTDINADKPLRQDSQAIGDIIIKLFDKTGQLVKTKISRNNKTVINISGLKEGLYHLKIIYNEEVIDEQVKIER